MRRFELKTTERFEAVDVTAQVREVVAASGLREGWVRLHCPHTTATLVVNEAADPDVMRDLLAAWQRLVPRDGGYRHAEGNSQAHILASLAGGGVTLPVADGRLRLGRWQGVFFVEMDGPRSREVWAGFVRGEEG